MKYLSSAPMVFGGGLGKGVKHHCPKCNSKAFSFVDGKWRCSSCGGPALASDAKDLSDKQFVWILRELAPQLYQDLGVVGRGFPEIQIGDGWHKLLIDASVRLEELIKHNESTKALSIETRGGALEISLNEYTDETNKVLEELRLESSEVCEVCGDDGYVAKDGTREPLALCEYHHDERQCFLAASSGK